MAAKDTKSIDILIPCLHNRQEHFVDTQKCLKSIHKHTPHDLFGKIIIVENLQTWMSEEANIYVSFDYQRTCAQNVNTGLQLSTSEYICVITNDVFVPEGYMEAMLKCFEIADCGIATLESSQFNRPAKDAIEEGFFGGIWMIKRDALNKIGYWDEQFEHAFDDADYWVRTYEAGYKIYVNRSVVVSHDIGAKTLQDVNGDNLPSVFDRNRELFNNKYKDCKHDIFNKLK